MTGRLTDLAISVVFGTAFGVGVCCLLAVTSRWGAASLSRRIAPYVRDISDPRGLTAWMPDVALTAAAVRTAMQAQLGRLLGGGAGVARRLRRAGREVDVAAFRGRQLAWGLGGVLVGGGVAVALALTGRFTAAAVLLPPVFAVVALVLCDVGLSSAARRRAARVEEELPTVLEFLALCLSAGEGLLDGLRRVGAVGSGELTGEVRAVTIAVSTGSSLAEALTAMARGLEVPALSRAVDHLVAAIDRGAPLAQVLQSQANDAREDARRALIEQAGRKEILMLVPLVFLVLPLSVIFAIFPGIFMLRLGIG